MMAGHLARKRRTAPGGSAAAIDAAHGRADPRYLWSLRHVLRWRRVMLVFTLGLIGLAVWLYMIVPKGFFPNQDTGLIIGTTRARRTLLPGHAAAAGEGRRRCCGRIRRSPASPPRSAAGNGNASVSQGRYSQPEAAVASASVTAIDVINRLRRAAGAVPGIQTLLPAVQDIGIGGRAGTAVPVRAALAGPRRARVWSRRWWRQAAHVPGLQDVSSDQQRAGPVARLDIDREQAARLGVSVQASTTR